MPNPCVNAKLFIELAEKGKSFAPHTPKRMGDQIGLFRAICWHCAYSNHQHFYYEFPIRIGENGARVLVLTPPNHQILIGCLEDSLPDSFYTTVVGILPVEVSPIAKLRILQYFAPILDGKVEWPYIQLLVKQAR